jgi:hypothetical protein
MISTLLKDYLEILHDMFLIGPEGAFELVPFLKVTLNYLIESIGLFFYYLISFHWVRDFMDLPVIFKHNYTVIAQGQNVLRKTYELKLGLHSGGYSFLDTSPINTMSIATGYLNSFFLSLPCTVPHFLSVRALLMNGVKAGASAALGTLIGQLLFFSCILFGFEFFLQPFFALEPFLILLGSMFIVGYISHLISHPEYKRYDYGFDDKQLSQLFGVNFILAWCEQICVNHFFGNFHFINAGSGLEPPGGYGLFVHGIGYLLGLAVGYIMWSIIFGYLVLRLYTASTYLFRDVAFVDIQERFDIGCLAIIYTLALSSFSYYGYDFFAGTSLGYVSEDAALERVWPTYRNSVPFADNKYMADSVQEKAEDDAEIGDIVLDIKPFHQSNSRPESAFEAFGLPSEYGWSNRDKLIDRTLEKEGTGSKQFLSFVRKKFKEDARYAHDKIDTFTTSKLDDDDMFYLYSSEAKRILQVLIRQTFRFDTYSELRDKSSNTYIPETQVYRKFRDLFQSNPVYKGILALEHLPVWLGEPATSRLSAQDENLLYKRRVILENYLSSMHKYRKAIEKSNVAFPEKVYNQQFKGSLDYVRRFNAVRLTERGPAGAGLGLAKNERRKVLKYDQPLYKTYSDEQFALLHEELKLKKKYSKPLRFLRLTDSRPLYIGWDNNLNKFLVKTVRVSESFEDGQQCRKSANDSSESGKNPTLPKSYQFQAWSPGVETATEGTETRFKIPILVGTYEEIIKAQEALRLIDDRKTMNDFDYELSRNKYLRLKKNLDKITLTGIFKRLPLYDWYWAALIAESPEYVPAFRIGDATIPKLDGIAWPGRNERCGLRISDYEYEQAVVEDPFEYADIRSDEEEYPGIQFLYSTDDKKDHKKDDKK